MASGIEPASVEPTDMAAAMTVTPGAARVPMTGVVDATEVFLGVRHRDYSEDNVTDEEQQKERNKKRRKTTNILDKDNIPNQNVILPLLSLFSFLHDNFICKSCHRNNHAEWELESMGLASSLMFCCSCGHSGIVRADLKCGSAAKVLDVDVGKPFSNNTNASDYEINNRFLLGLQIAGSGRKEAEIIPDLLNLSNGFMTKRYTDLQNELGVSIIGLSTEILRENLRLEIEASPRVVNGRTALSVSSDARWDKRGSGRRYDSLSGCSVMLGNRTKLVIAVEAMSQVCSKCRLGLPHEDSKMYKKLREGRQKLISDNQWDLTYSSGMMMETEAEEEARSRKTRSTSGERRCPHCNEDSHQRRTSRLCPKNKRNLDRAEAASMRDAQKRAKVSTTFENIMYCTMW
jgi:hypothetical protein